LRHPSLNLRRGHRVLPAGIGGGTIRLAGDARRPTFKILGNGQGKCADAYENRFK
jgi:hypothetical protein